MAAEECIECLEAFDFTFPSTSGMTSQRYDKSSLSTLIWLAFGEDPFTSSFWCACIFDDISFHAAYGLYRHVYDKTLSLQPVLNLFLSVFLKAIDAHVCKTSLCGQ